MGNAQTIGSYEIQSNYFSTRNGDFALAVLADGTIDHINGRRCAVLAVEACMREVCGEPACVDFPSFFDRLAGKILKEMREVIYRGKTPYLSLSFLLIRERKLNYYTVGNNQVFLFDGQNFRLLRKTYGCEAFERGATAGMISGGVGEALYEKDLVSYLEKDGHPYDKAQRLIQGVIERNKKKAGNATVVLVEDGL